MSKWVTTVRAARGDFFASVLMAKAIILDFWREKGAFTDPASSCNLPLSQSSSCSSHAPYIYAAAARASAVELVGGQCYCCACGKKPDVQRQVFMRHACAPTPPPRWPATHSTRRSTAGAANAPRAAFCHTSRARSPPTRAPTPPLSCHLGQVAELPAPKALLPT